MGNQLKDMQDYAKKRQKGIGAFVNPNAGDVEKGNAMFNNATDVGSAPTSGGMGEDFESTDNMRGKKNMKSINIREELNKRDMQSCKTDFVNMYESANLSEEKKMQLVKLLSENVSNKKLMEWFDEGSGVKKVYWTAHPGEDDILDSWETLESAIESCKRHRYNYVVSAIERDEDDNRDNWADDWNTEWENPDFKDVFTPEEQEEYGIDEEGNSIDSYDTYHRCVWCEEPTPEARKELNMGWLCPYCAQELVSRGEKPVFDDYGAFESLKESKETDKVVKRAKEVIGKLSDIGDASLEVEDVGALKRLRKEIDSLLGKKDLKEEYGAYKDELYCEEIANQLENGSDVGSVNGVSWELEMHSNIGEITEDKVSPKFYDYMLHEVSYPVRDGHLRYMDLNIILDNQSIGDDFTNEDLKSLGFSNEEITEFRNGGEIETWIDYDVNFDVDEYERSNIDLPDEVTYDFYTLVDDGIDIESDDYYLDDVIADRLSDDYGYTHFGFNYDINKESGDVYVYDIKWDLSESLKEDVRDNRYNIKETEEEIFDILGIEPENYENSKHLLPQFRKLARKWDENNIWLRGDLGHYINGKIVDETEDLIVVDENPKGSHTNTNKEPLKQATFVIDEGPRYTGYDEEYSWNGWACPWFTKEESLKIAGWLNSYIVDTLTFDETKDAFKYVPQDDSGDIDYYIGADINTEDGVKHLYPIGNKSWTWDNVSDYDDIDDDMDDFYAVKKYDLD